MTIEQANCEQLKLFCEDIVDIFRYYPLDENENIVVKVEDLPCTDEIKIVAVVPRKHVEKIVNYKNDKRAGKLKEPMSLLFKHKKGEKNDG